MTIQRPFEDIDYSAAAMLDRLRQSKPRRRKPEPGWIIGTAPEGGPLVIPYEKLFQTHVDILGPTGFGKSYLTYSLACQSILAGHGVVVISGPREQELGRALEQRLPETPGLRHWVGQRGLRELVGFFGAAAERGARLIACDSGPMHLAWSCGVRVVLLAGPQDPALTGPWPTDQTPGRRGPHTIVRAAPAPACAPCFARRCTHPEGTVCMSGIDPEDVARALH